MELLVDPDHVDFMDEGRLAGRYVHGDEYKPYMHPLNTPAGHTISLLSPHDHKHHKGLMYALRASDVNFWEERATVPDEAVGRQRHDGFVHLVEHGDSVSFTERLTWLGDDGCRESFREERAISCHLNRDRNGYVWRWFARLEALRDLELVMSQWTLRKPDGSRVNYHGLGLRLRRDFGCTGGNKLYVDGEATAFDDALGMTPGEVSFQGSLDSIWPVQMAAVTFAQEQENALFVVDSPFAFMGLGPTNLAPVKLDRSGVLFEVYTITVLDCTTPER